MDLSRAFPVPCPLPQCSSPVFVCEVLRHPGTLIEYFPHRLKWSCVESSLCSDDRAGIIANGVTTNGTTSFAQGGVTSRGREAALARFVEVARQNGRAPQPVNLGNLMLRLPGQSHNYLRAREVPWFAARDCGTLAGLQADVAIVRTPQRAVCNSE